MARIQPNAHSFVVKVWLASPKDGGGWRGRITHVPSGQSCHFARLSDITQFVRPYLHQLGVTPSWSWKVHERLREWWRKRQ